MAEALLDGESSRSGRTAHRPGYPHRRRNVNQHGR